MRTIKFRAWIKRLNVMRDIKKIYFDAKIVGFGLLPEDTFEDCWHFDLIELMEFTGQKDAGGDEFCEGDIFEDDSHWYQVVWDEADGCWWAMGIRGNEDNMSLSEFGKSSDSWIQGNIYQNPEWLK